MPSFTEIGVKTFVCTRSFSLIYFLHIGTLDLSSLEMTLRSLKFTPTDSRVSWILHDPDMVFCHVFLTLTIVCLGCFLQGVGEGGLTNC